MQITKSNQLDQQKLKKKTKKLKKRKKCAFIDDEAAVSGGDSSDDDLEDFLTQVENVTVMNEEGDPNVDMEAKYLQSVRFVVKFSVHLSQKYY